MSSVKKSIETAESAQAAGAGTGEDAVREAQREAMAPARVAEEGDPNMTFTRSSAARRWRCRRPWR